MFPDAAAQLDHRTCPGNHFTLRTLFLNIACILAVFDILVPLGEKLEAKYNEGYARCVETCNPYFVAVTILYPLRQPRLMAV